MTNPIENVINELEKTELKGPKNCNEVFIRLKNTIENVDTSIYVKNWIKMHTCLPFGTKSDIVKIDEIINSLQSKHLIKN